MKRLGSFCKLAVTVLVPITVSAQSMVSYGTAAATGSTAGTAAGSKLNKALDDVFTKTSKSMEKAGVAPETKKTKPAELIHVSVAADGSKVAAVKPSASHPHLKPPEAPAAEIMAI